MKRVLVVILSVLYLSVMGFAQDGVIDNGDTKANQAAQFKNGVPDAGGCKQIRGRGNHFKHCCNEGF